MNFFKRQKITAAYLLPFCLSLMAVSPGHSDDAAGISSLSYDLPGR